MELTELTTCAITSASQAVNPSGSDQQSTDQANPDNYRVDLVYALPDYAATVD